MKHTARYVFPLLVIFALFLFSCQKESSNTISPTDTNASGPLYCGDHNGNNGHNGNGKGIGNVQPIFEINLVSDPLQNNGNGPYIWIWTVTNTNAVAKDADNKHGIKDDDHDCGDKDDDDDCYNGHRLNFWFISLGSDCNLDNILQAGYSYDGVHYKYFKPTYKVENVIKTVYSEPVLKFPHGTFGNKPTYYKLVVNAFFDVNPLTWCVLKYGSTRELRTFDGMGTPFYFDMQ